MSIYVEIRIRAPMDALWRHTQEPRLHERWDLRFSEIEYLPRVDETQPQRFRYATRVGFGLRIVGEGESVGQRDQPDGSCTSLLTFDSSDPRSVIREGGGWWKYVPTPDGIRFMTQYDYRTRGGAAGRVFDRLVFRPLLGWATAWSFDRLRLWLERGVDPTVAMRSTVARAVARVGVAFVFAYHGLVPKLLCAHPDEIAMLRDIGLSSDAASRAIVVGGVAELGLAACMLILWRRKWPSWTALGFLLLATVGVAVNSPRFIGAAFNPVSLDVATACLAAIDLLLVSDVPSATRCLRSPERAPA